MHFVFKFQYFELILTVYFKTVFFLKFSESLPISIDPFCFSIDRKFLNMFERASVYFERAKLFFDRSKLVKHVFLKVRLDFSKALFQKRFSIFPLSPTWLRLHHRFFVVFLPVFCKVFVLEGR